MVSDIGNTKVVQSLDVHLLVSLKVLNVLEEVSGANVIGTVFISPNLPYNAWFFGNALRQFPHPFLHFGVRFLIDFQKEVPNFLCAHAFALL